MRSSGVAGCREAGRIGPDARRERDEVPCGGSDLCHDLGQPRARHEVVAHQRRDPPRGDHRRGDQRMGVLRACAPVPAMDEHVQRGAGRRLPREDEIVALSGRRPVADVAVHPGLRGEGAAAGLRLRHDRVEVRDEVPVPVEVRFRHRADPRLQNSTAKYLGSMNSRMPVTPPSRPSPLCFAPPNGAAGSDMRPRLMPTMPVSMPRPTRIARMMSRE